MQREEKAMDSALEALISRVTELKNTLAAFLVKLEHEHETLSWPSVLDNFALLSGQVNTLLKVVRNEKMPLLRNLAVLPLQLSPERDEELVKLTESRVQVFNHEVVPDYLRTKADPDVEQREQQIIHKSCMMTQEMGMKQVSNTHKICTNVLELISNVRENWESEAGARAQIPQTYTQNDTVALLSAVSAGKGLKGPMKLGVGGVTTSGPSQQHPQTQQAVGSMSKVPSAIKTNIKSASSVHPYGR